MTDIGDHYRDTDGAIYRVVGITENVTLLRVTDAAGRRIHSGDLQHVAPATLDAAFEPTQNPDSRFAPMQTVQNILSGLYWSVRQIL